MGFWICLEAEDGSDLDLSSFESLLAQLPGVEAREPKIVKEGQAYSLWALEKTSETFPPIIEVSQKRFLVYGHWSDNSQQHGACLTRSVLDHNRLKGICYDGYKHKDNEAIQSFLKLFCFQDCTQHPESVKGFLEPLLLKKPYTVSVRDEYYWFLDFGSASLCCEQDDWIGQAPGPLIESVTMDWFGQVTFTFIDGKTARLKALVDDWFINDLDDRQLVVGSTARGVRQCSS